MIETERLVLRPLTVDDAEFMVELLNDASFLRFVGDRKVRTVEQATDYIATGPVESYRRFGFGLFLTRLKEPHTPIGICGLLKRTTLDDVDLGFALLPSFRSKGYATEAAAAMLSHGRTALGLGRIVAVASPDNAASMHVLQKLGFRFERKVRLSQDGPEIDLLASEAHAEH